jgi:hypothetical protein
MEYRRQLQDHLDLVLASHHEPSSLPPNYMTLIRHPPQTEADLMDENDASWNDENIEELDSLLASTPEDQPENCKTKFSSLQRL